MLLYSQATIDFLSELVNQQLLKLDGNGGATLHTVVYNDPEHIYITQPNGDVVPVTVAEVFRDYLLYIGATAYHMKPAKALEKYLK